MDLFPIVPGDSVLVNRAGAAVEQDALAAQLFRRESGKWSF